MLCKFRRTLLFFLLEAHVQALYFEDLDHGTAEVKPGLKIRPRGGVAGFRDKIKMRELDSLELVGPRVQLRVYISRRVRGTGRRGRLGDVARWLGGKEGYRCIALARPPLLHVPSLLLFSPVPPRTFRFSSSSSSDLANARPSFPSPSRPLRASSLRAWLRVQSLTSHRARLIAVALTYCAIRCTRSASAPLRFDEKEAPRAQNAFTFYLGMRSRENCVLQLDVCPAELRKRAINRKWFTAAPHRERSTI